MKRLFIDVDDTLVIWGEGERETDFSDPFKINKDIVLFAIQWSRENPTGVVIVWSGGGIDYARTWGDRIFGDDFPWIPFGKVPMNLREGDMFIDDSPWDAWKHLNTHPSEIYKELKNDT